jgi:hypothetical protein
MLPRAQDPGPQTHAHSHVLLGYLGPRFDDDLLPLPLHRHAYHHVCGRAAIPSLLVSRS